MKTRNAALATSINKKRYAATHEEKYFWRVNREQMKVKLTTSSYISYLHKHSHMFILETCKVNYRTQTQFSLQGQTLTLNLTDLSCMWII